MRLASSARFDYTWKLAAELALRGNTPQENFTCVSAIPLEVYTSPISDFLESKLSGEEISTAIAFYESSAGVKYTQHGIVQFYKIKGISTDMEPPDIGDNEMQQIVAFSRTGAGMKMMNLDFPRAMAISVKAAEGKALRACGFKGAL